MRKIEAYVDEEEIDLEHEFWQDKKCAKMFWKWLENEKVSDSLFKDYGVEHVEDETIEGGIRLFFRASLWHTREFMRMFKEPLLGNDMICSFIDFYFMQMKFITVNTTDELMFPRISEPFYIAEEGSEDQVFNQIMS